MRAVRIMRTARIVVAAVIVGTVRHRRHRDLPARAGGGRDDRSGAGRCWRRSPTSRRRRRPSRSTRTSGRGTHFIPPEVFERHGMVYADMDFEQRVRALDLLRSGLSYTGYLTAQQIMEVEGILGVLSSKARVAASRAVRTSTGSRCSGRRESDGTWGWRWEGHHLSLHYTIVDGRDHRQHAHLPGRQSGDRAVRAAARHAGDEGAGGHGPGAARLAQRRSARRRHLRRRRSDQRRDGRRPGRRPARFR